MNFILEEPSNIVERLALFVKMSMGNEIHVVFYFQAQRGATIGLAGTSSGEREKVIDEDIT